MEPRISVSSEIGVLEKVILHSPGPEIEEMTPKSAEQVLYNDIIPLPVIAEDHRELREILSMVTSTYETKDLFIEILKNNAVKAEFIKTVCSLFPEVKSRRDEFECWSPEECATSMIEGVRQKKNTLTSYLSDTIFDLPPLPNLYFMRDSAIVVGSKVVTGSMATRVRMIEALIMKFIYKYHADFKAEGFLFDGMAEGSLGNVTIEGGDLLVLRHDCLAIGVSERTTPQSIDRITDALARDIHEPFHIFAVVLPKERATIHLDMVFTMADKHSCVVYKPYVLGHQLLPVVKISIFPDGKKTYEQVKNLLTGLKTVGMELEPVICGGENPLYQEREQWLSGTNFFAFAPGKIIGYDCNSRTLDELSKAGFEICKAKDILSGKKNSADYNRLVIGIAGAELARGGGGVRCMTMPAKRKPVAW